MMLIKPILKITSNCFKMNKTELNDCSAKNVLFLKHIVLQKCRQGHQITEWYIVLIPVQKITTFTVSVGRFN